jgi:hypothetical protein
MPLDSKKGQLSFEGLLTRAKDYKQKYQEPAPDVNKEVYGYPPRRYNEKQVRNDGDNAAQREMRDVEAGNANEPNGDENGDMILQDADELEGGLGEHAFHHPALYREQVRTFKYALVQIADIALLLTADYLAAS